MSKRNALTRKMRKTKPVVRKMRKVSAVATKKGEISQGRGNNQLRGDLTKVFVLTMLAVGLEVLLWYLWK